MERGRGLHRGFPIKIMYLKYFEQKSVFRNFICYVLSMSVRVELIVNIYTRYSVFSSPI
jgi:hypothetical protein